MCSLRRSFKIARCSAVTRDAYWAIKTPSELRAMSKLYASFLVIASMLALSALGMLGLVLIAHVIDLVSPSTSQ
jgi:hypothetical protein